VDTAVVLGWLGSALFLARLIPQPLRLSRTGVSHGVSSQAAVNATVSDIGWFVYGIGAALAPVWVCAGLAVPLDLWTAWLLRRTVSVATIGFGAAWAVAMALAWWIGGGIGLGTVLGASVLVNHAPQVWAAVRGRDLAGIAPATWLIAIADACLWGGYGIFVHDPALITYGAVLLSAAAVVLVRIAQVGGWSALRPSSSAGIPDPVEPI
jgi:uncharacterized protein with PQ loop repeat